MRFLALAVDYDGTLASGRVVAEETWEAAQRLRGSGRKLIFVSGRELEDLQNICPHLDYFDRVVAENGAVLHAPQTREVRALGPAPPAEFLQALRERGVAHLGVGRSIVATVEPYYTAAIDAISELGLERHVVFNKGAVMVLPPGVNKATSLQAALEELGFSPQNVVAIGDAENDHAFLSLCECAAVVSNALPKLRERGDIVTSGEEGKGVIQLIDELLEDDLARHSARLSRHDVLLGSQQSGHEVRLVPYRTVGLLAGPAGSGKPTTTTGLLERLATAGYQFCVIDPEGDYEEIHRGVVLGDPEHAPSDEEVLQLLPQPRENVVVNLLRIAHGRPAAVLRRPVLAHPGAARADRPAALAGFRRSAPPSPG
jgi:HAD superfamily hydrolase (TIGR01484 family)